MSYWWAIEYFWLFNFEMGSKMGPDSKIMHIGEVYKMFIFHPILTWLLLLNGSCWELSVECQCISIIFYSFRDKLDQKRPKSVNFQNLNVFIFHTILMHFYTPVLRWAVLCDWVWRVGGHPHRFPHNNFSSVYRIFTKLGYMIPL